MKNLKKEFEKEFDTLKEAERLFDDKNKKNKGFELIKSSYIDLIKQQSKLMRIGDKTQKRLRDAQAKILRELRLASEYVTSLLPDEFEDKDIEIAYHFEPSEQLGGDALGFHYLDDDNLAVYLLDVSGHGVGPALHSVSVINNLRFDTLRDTDFREPSSVLNALNNKYIMGEYNNMFFTIFYAVYNKKERLLKYSEGGHPHANLHTSDKLIVLEGGGPAIGFFPNTDYEQKEINIDTETFLYVYSDAAFEFPKKDGGMSNKKDLENILTLHGKESTPHNIYSHILTQSTKRHLDDDFSFIKIHIK